MTETSDGKEIAERLIALMRNGKQESIRLKAACELRDWLFGSPSPDRALALNGPLSEVRGEIVRFVGSFGPPRRAPGDEAKDDTVVEVGAVVEAEASRVDMDGTASDAEGAAESAETPVETSE